MKFDDFWDKGVELLRAGMENSADGGKYIVDIWTSDKGIQPLKFPVIDADSEEIRCLSIYASKEMALTKEDMEALYDIWDDYVSGEATRMDIIESVPRPTYCVAIMKLWKDKIS